ncbi:MAG: aminotransferase class V-fold PLP-dependent enzyme [Bacteroidales bacterium]|nr:aminotransferase class V-fold PLP-dependent enzyme [Bacteroidales bacterium]
MRFDYIRSQFPGLGTDWVLLDNAGGSQILKPVVERINEHFYSSNVQLGGTYPHSMLAEERHEKAHLDLMRWVNADDPSEIILGSSTSLLVRTLAGNFSRIWKPGDEIIVTNCDHEANIGAWRELADRGIVVKEWKINPETFELEQEELKKLLTNRTKMVAFTAASNVLGMLNPVAEFAALAHSAGAMVCVDSVAYAPHRLIDVKEWDADFVVFSFYKTYGPHYAMMYGKREILDQLPGNNHFFIEESPYKFQPGNYKGYVQVRLFTYC